MVEDKFSCIKELTKTVHIALPSSYISNEIAGVTDILESWKRQYNRQLQGIVVSYKNISLMCKSGSIVIDKPYVHYDIKATFELFCPSTGSIVQGKVNRVSHDYIGCLVHNTINATIKRFGSSLDGLSEFIALDRMILFKITCFGYHQKVIKVRGEITEECVNLMKELSPFNTQSGILQDSLSSYFSTPELSEYTVNSVGDKEEHSQSLIAPNYSFHSTNKGIFNVDHLADRTSNDVSSTPHESDSSEEVNTDLENKSEKHNLHKMFTMLSEEEMDIDDPISDFKSPTKIKKHKNKKSKDKSFNTTESHSLHHKKSSSKKKKSIKNKTLNDSSFDTVSSIETSDEFKISLSPNKKKSSKLMLNTSELKEFSSPQRNAVNPISTLSSNNFNADLTIKEEVPTDSDYNSLSSKKKSKKSKNKSSEGHLNNNIKEMNVFAAFEPNLEGQLHFKDISSGAIKEEPVAAIKRDKKRKRESSDKDGHPAKKKKSEGDKSASGKSKDKSKKKEKSKKHKKNSKNKKLKSKKAQLSYKIKSKKKKKDKDKSRSKKLKKSSKDKIK